MTPKAAFRFALLSTLAIKFALAYVLPMSGDEAYFLTWGQHPDYGFYDHPPMVGWLLQFLLTFGSSEVVLRLPAILLTTLIGIGIYRLLEPYDENRAALVAMLYLVSPLNVLNVLITTDTPLILFSFLSVAALFRALQKDSLPWYALSGVFLGLAFLSKYFAVLLGLAYLAYFFLARRERRAALGFATLFLVALPFVAVNLYWNYTHCWDNILFNLYSRNEGEHFSFGSIAIFAGMMVYLMTPPAIYYLFKHRAGLMQRIALSPYGLFVYVFVLPMAMFTLLSALKVIGLHWVLSFYAFFFVSLALLLTREELVKTIKFTVWLTGAHLAAIVLIAFLPMDTWKHNKLYDGIVFMFKTDEIVDRVHPYGSQFLLAADGYSPAAIISYHYGRNFFVFGGGSHYARQDDIITDFRQFAGRDILILKKSPPDMAEYAPYFLHVEVESFELHGVPFYFVLGYGFNYDAYRTQVLKPIKDKYYAIPSWLPHASCYFCEKYFPDEGK